MKLMTTQLYNSLHLPMLHAISTRGHVAFVSNFSSPNRLHDGISNLVLVVKGLERFLRSGCLLVVFIFLDGCPCAAQAFDTSAISLCLLLLVYSSD